MILLCCLREWQTDLSDQFFYFSRAGACPHFYSCKNCEFWNQGRVPHLRQLATNALEPRSHSSVCKEEVAGLQVVLTVVVRDYLHLLLIEVLISWKPNFKTVRYLCVCWWSIYLYTLVLYCSGRTRFETYWSVIPTIPHHKEAIESFESFCARSEHYFYSTKVKLKTHQIQLWLCSGRKTCIPRIRRLLLVLRHCAHFFLFYEPFAPLDYLKNNKIAVFRI